MPKEDYEKINENKTSTKTIQTRNIIQKRTQLQNKSIMDECAMKMDLNKIITKAVIEAAKTYQPIKQDCLLRKEEASLRRTRKAKWNI